MIFTSDHGEMAGSHGLRQKGNLVYDENFHVPLIICHPDVDGGASTAGLASAVDLAPTLLSFAGMDDARIATEFPRLHGHSLAPLVQGADRVRDGVLTAVESVITIDGDFWAQFGRPDSSAADAVRRTAPGLDQARLPARVSPMSVTRSGGTSRR